MPRRRATPPALRLSDILRYAESRIGTLTCPLCGHDDFSPAAGQEDKPMALLYEDSGRSWFGPPGYLRVYALSCKNCSYIVMFKLEALEKWASQRRRARESDT